MSEEYARSKQYEYRQNSNLVLEPDKSENRRRNDEATGEVESLVGKISYKMGDLVKHGGKELQARLEKSRKKKRARDTEKNVQVKKRVRKTAVWAQLGKGSDVLTETTGLDTVGYRPKTKKTRVAYESMLSFVAKELGGAVPEDILQGAADEILHVLKNIEFSAKKRQKEVESLTGAKMDAVRFNQLVTIGTQITDFAIEADDEDEDDKEQIDEDMGVAVIFDDEDDENDNDDVDEIRDGDEEDEEDNTVEARSGVKISGAKDDDDMEATDELNLSVEEIDAHWLQRELANFYDDANVTQEKAEETLALLAIKDERDCENKLIMLLDFDKFNFIKILLRNRSKINYCTRLKQAQSDEERKGIEEEMSKDVDGGGPAILEALYKTQTAEDWAKSRTAEFVKKTRLEAQSIRQQNVEPTAETGDASAAALGSSLKPMKGAIDLDNLTFQQGARFMSNTQCTLPAKSWRVTKKGYEEVHVPALKTPPYASGESLKPIASLPEWIQPAFAVKNMKSLNRVQSKVYSAAFEQSDNLLLGAPTGAGKTNVAMLTIMRELGLQRNEDGTFNRDRFKVVYVAPMKALVQETVINFSDRLKAFGLVVRELSGDSSLTRQQIAETHVIVTTPEKWDIITRKSGERTFTQLVKLLIIDEVHLLHDTRGAVLESIVARTLRQTETTQELIRIVGLSATMPNYQDVARFLRVDPKKGLHFFDNSYRPVPLQQQYIGITEKKPIKRFNIMNEITYEKVMEEAGKEQIIIFVHARKDCAKTARHIRDQAMEDDVLSKFIKDDPAIREILMTESETAKNADLKDLLPYGFGIHHAGLQRADRNLVEDLFADGTIQVLVSTATLAWGVNLPAHTVIIKGTQIYNPEKGCWTELSYLDIMQMLGRAGRPQFDTFGEGIVITTHTELQYYLSLMNQQLPIESQYISRLPDNLNAEIVMGTVQNLSEAVQWLGYTYLYVRMLRNPSLYGITEEQAEQDPNLEQRRVDLVHSAAALIAKYGLIKYDKRAGTFQVTALGRVASHYYVSYNSISTFNDYLKPSMSEIELFRLFSLSYEFRHIVVRQEEKQELAKLLERVPIPVKEGMEEPSAKINVLLQTYISMLKLEGFGLISDMVYVQQSAGRILRALFEITLCRGWAALAEKTLNLCKMVDKRIWLSHTPLRQFSGVPKEILKRIDNKDISWERYYDLKSQDIGELIRYPKMGRKIYRLVHMFPRLDLTAHIQPITRAVLKVELGITADFAMDDAIHGWGEAFHIFVEDVDGEELLHHEMFLLKKRFVDDEHTVTFTVPIYDPMPPQYFIRVVSDRWLHAETTLPISFRHLILPDKYPPHTELLDLQPLPVEGLRYPAFQALYSHLFTHFNPIQTQVFNTVYETDDNVLVTAPAGSGKTIAAEFSILRMLKNDPRSRCVYVAPVPEVCEQRFQDWSMKFGQGLKKRVVKLTGETATDLKLLEVGQIVIATPKQWDILSRRWKQRHLVKNVSLFIVDELHLIGGQVGPTLEIVVSRMRFIASQTGGKMRIVGLGASVANARDLGEWLGASSHGMFNFLPTVRPVPLEIRIQGFNIGNFGARMLAMSKPVYNSVLLHAPRDPVIVYVPSRKQSQLTAVDLMSFAAGSGDAKRFLKDAKAVEAALGVVQVSAATRETLSHGIGVYHDGMSARQQAEVMRLFKSGAIQILVSTYNMCWSVSCGARLVTVMGTSYFDGREHRYLDYPITDVLQMLGHAGRANVDDSGVCVILCHEPQKEYYKKFLTEPLPVESHLDHCLHDHMNAEIVTKTIENKQDAVDYLTWTFFYRRLPRNPNYYNMDGVTPAHISDHLSNLVEATLENLVESNCISMKDELVMQPLNLGMIGAYYYIQYTTIELFAESVTPKAKLAGLLKILSAATEYSEIAVHASEDAALKKLSHHLQQKVEKTDSASFKANVLLQAHFSRMPLSSDLRGDQKVVLGDAIRFLQAMVDVISSNGWLKPALAAMELSQMVVQARWAWESPLAQVPHFTKEITDRLQKHHEANRDEDDDEEFGVMDILEMEDDERSELLQLPDAQMTNVAQFCNAFPDIEVSYQVEDADNIKTNDIVEMKVTLEREVDEDDDISQIDKVVALNYPYPKREGWWLVVGDVKANSLMSIKRISLRQKSVVTLEFPAPSEVGTHGYTLYFMCDSYLHVDQEYKFEVDVKEHGSSSSDSDSDSDTSDEE